MADHLRKDDADTKHLFIISDMLSHNDLVSFYDYKYRPSDIMEEFELIAERLQSDMQIDLSEIDITIIHRPKMSLDELGVQVRRFWRKYLLEYCNAKSINFVAGINKTT